MQKNFHNIINLSHHVSKTRPQMSIYKRAAQFAPFAALSCYEEIIEETTRPTEDFVDYDEERMNMLSLKLNIIKEHILEKPLVEFTYFVPDEKKTGG